MSECCKRFRHFSNLPAFQLLTAAVSCVAWNGAVTSTARIAQKLKHTFVIFGSASLKISLAAVKACSPRRSTDVRLIAGGCSKSMSSRNIAVALPGYMVSAEVLLRILLVGAALSLEFVDPFERKIQPEETWLYRNPQTASFVPVRLLFILVVLAPSSTIIAMNYFFPCNRSDISAAHLGFTLALGLTAFVTNLTKVLVGRPRPDFFFRCFPTGVGNFSLPCTGIPQVITEGRKSFPSGHSSLAFSSFTFLSFYLLAKLQALNSVPGRLRTHRVLLGVLPFVAASMIAISRTCDYHHHWQDVLVGSMLGAIIAFACYRQQYPSLFDADAAIPLADYPVYDIARNNEDLLEVSAGSFIQNKANEKWI